MDLIYNYNMYCSCIELRAELDRMEKVIDAMIGPQIEKHRRQQQELKEKSAWDSMKKPKMPQITATVSILFIINMQ